MAKLPDVSLKLVADIEDLLKNLKKVDKEVANTTTKVSAEMDKMGKAFAKKFSVSDIGKSVLSGFGIGSGMAVAEKLTGLIVGHWEQAAKMAQDIEASTQRQLDYTMRGIDARRTDDQRVAAGMKESARLYRELEQMKSAPRKFSFLAPVKSLNLFGFGDEERSLQQNNKTEEINAVHSRIDAATARLKEEEKRKRKSASDAFAKQDDDDARAIIQTNEKNLEILRRAREQHEEDKRKVAIETLKNIQDAEEADSRQKIEDRLKLSIMDAELEYDIWAEAQEKKNKTAEAFSLEATRIIGLGADQMADAFVDTFNGVEGAFSNLGKTIKNEIAKIIIQLLIVKPLMNSIGGLFGGGDGILGTIGTAFTSYGGGKAVGGPVSSGTTYTVGENGPELFTPSASGVITPNNKIGSGGNTYVIDARGTDESVVSRLAMALKSLAGPGVVERRALGAISDHMRRGGSFA